MTTKRTLDYSFMLTLIVSDETIVQSAFSCHTHVLKYLIFRAVY